MLVVIGHAISQISTFPSVVSETFGGAGVDIFFSISGFIMTLVATARESEGVLFAKSRIVRIVPLYWTATSLTAAIYIVSAGVFRNTELTLRHFLLSMLFIPHANPGLQGSMSPLLRPGWTLNFEMFFYLIFFIALIAPTTYKKTFIGVTIVCFILFGSWVRPSGAIGFYCNSIMLEFVYGIVVGAAFRARLIVPNPVIGGILVAVGFGAIATFTPLFTSDNRFLLFGLPAATILIGGIMFEAQAKQLTALKTVGDASYSIYLFHIFVVSFCRIFWLKSHLPITTAVWEVIFVAGCTISSAAVGAVIFHYLEKPLLRTSRMLVFGRRTTAPA